MLYETFLPVHSLGSTLLSSLPSFFPTVSVARMSPVSPATGHKVKSVSTEATVPLIPRQTLLPLFASPSDLKQAVGLYVSISAHFSVCLASSSSRLSPGVPFLLVYAYIRQLPRT
mmetsp:Transcript_12241/g.21227  ORF Transcript_12241/g.21227 Transcript_12241/m.21227 type:complete len:115 (-) Transcript_12241:6-350(-)